MHISNSEVQGRLSPEAQARVDDFLDNTVKVIQDPSLRASAKEIKIFENFCQCAKNDAEFAEFQRGIKDLISGDTVTVTIEGGSRKSLLLKDKGEISKLREVKTEWNTHVATIRKDEDKARKMFSQMHTDWAKNNADIGAQYVNTIAHMVKARHGATEAFIQALSHVVVHNR